MKDERTIPSPLGKSKFFPQAEKAGPEGIVRVGGKLTTDWLLDAYEHGIFPWPIPAAGCDLAWFSPARRAIFELDQFHASRRLLRTCRSGKFTVTCDQDFAAVIHACATVGDRPQNNWITSGLLTAYVELHRLGHAHSVEVWHAGQLAGGLYGVALGGLFAGESMFYRVRDASKVALFHLVQHLQARGYSLFDVQVLTPHTASLGAREISRAEYLQRLAAALLQDVTFG
jgi:leucyl/phenylalanyl-tRNA--protein transferase